MPTVETKTPATADSHPSLFDGQPSLFEELPPVPAKGYRATLVRSHTRRLPGDPETTAEETPKRSREASSLPASTPAKQIKAPDPRTKAPVPHNGTSTSREGAAVAEAREQAPGKVSQYERIRLLLLAHNQRGLTRQEIAERSSIKLASVCGRVSQLISDGVCIETGLTKLGPDGCHQKLVQVGELRPPVVQSSCPECKESFSLESRLYHIEGHGYLSVRICSKCGHKGVG